MTTNDSPPNYNELNLYIPNGFRDEFIQDSNRLVSLSEQRAPFRRQVDLWWFAIETAVREGLKTPLTPPVNRNFTIFNNGAVLAQTPWRIHLLEMLVLGEHGQEAALNPSTVIQAANEYAYTGFNRIAEEIRGINDPEVHLLSIIP